MLDLPPTHKKQWNVKVGIGPSLRLHVRNAVLHLTLMGNNSGSGNHMFVWVSIWMVMLLLQTSHKIPSKEVTCPIFQAVRGVLFVPRRTSWLDLQNATPAWWPIFPMVSPWESSSNDAITYSTKTHLCHATGGGLERYPSLKLKAKEDYSLNWWTEARIKKQTKDVWKQQIPKLPQTDSFFCCYEGGKHKGHLATSVLPKARLKQNLIW